jgi:hypothetical protein
MGLETEPEGIGGLQRDIREFSGASTTQKITERVVTRSHIQLEGLGR